MARAIPAAVVVLLLLLSRALLADAQLARLEHRAASDRYEPADLRGPDFPDGQDRVTVPLPSRFRTFGVGGGGRYYVFHCPDKKQLAIVDLFKREVARTIDAPGDADVRFAAGLEHLFVASGNKLERYEFHTFTRDRSVALTDGRPDSIKVGVDAQNHLLVSAGGRTRFFDPGRLTPSVDATEFNDLENCRLSASGHYVATPRGELFRLDFQHGVLPVFTVPGHHAPGARFQPSADGRFVLHANQITQRTGRRLPAQPDDVQLVPSLDPRFAWAVRPAPPMLERSPAAAAEKPLDHATLLAIHDATPLVTLTDLEPIVAADSTSRGEQRLWHVPSNNALVLIPTTDDRVVIRRFNLHAALEATKQPYLFVQSLPPTVAPRGQTLHYAMDVVAKLRNQGLAYDVEKGPPGMTVSVAGHVAWPCPPDFAADSTDVVVRVRDKSGAAVRHAFTLLTPSRQALDAPLRPEPVVARVPAIPSPPPTPALTPPVPLRHAPESHGHEMSATARGLQRFLVLVAVVVGVAIVLAVALVLRFRRPVALPHGAASGTLASAAAGLTKWRRTCARCRSTFEFSPAEAATQRFCPHCGHPA